MSEAKLEALIVANSHAAEGRVMASIVASSLIGLAFGIASVATPHWHTTDNAFAHNRRGLFDACSAEMVNGVLEEYCQPLSIAPFCGHDTPAIRQRFTWPAVFAILSLIVLFSIPFGATVSWCLYKPRPGVLLTVSMTAMVLMVIGMTIYLHTVDSWYFCEREFCEYARMELGNTGLCVSQVGYSFVLGLLYLVCCVVTMVLSALYMRWVRQGVIVEQRKKSKDGADGGDAAAAGQDASEPYGTEDGVVVSDWVWDAEAAMHWSASNRLYLHPVTRHFYDPDTQSWFDPATGTWTAAL